MNKIRFKYFYYLVTRDSFYRPSKINNLLSYFSLSKYVIFYFYCTFTAAAWLLPFSPVFTSSIDFIEVAIDFFSIDWWADPFSKECELESVFFVDFKD